MNLTITRTDGGMAVKATGDLLISDVAEAKINYVAVWSENSDIRLDLSEIGEIDTAGLQLLLMFRASARTKDRRLAISGHSASLLAVLERTGIPAACFDCQRENCRDCRKGKF